MSEDERYMRLDEAKEIIKTIIRGYHPTTDIPFPSFSPYNHPKIVNALKAILTIIEDDVIISNRIDKHIYESVVQIQNHNLAKGKPKNFGFPWTPKLKEELSMLFEEGKTFEELAEIFGRTEISIKCELQSQGYNIENPYKDFFD